MAMAFWLAGLVVQAQIKGESKGDARVSEALNEAKLQFTELANGNFRLHFTLDGDRTQLVFIDTKTSTMGIFEIRDVWAIGYQSTELPSQEVLAKLLTDSATRKVGAWELHENEGTYYALFNIKVAADCSGEGLKSILWAAAEVADAMEKDLLGTDDL
ncbi:MAG: hypothetical protein KJ726_11760 [Verrucomicrobia bacterium]|nr:hypothetical protein [Verrucomicrobiota bacterium]MBU1910713.1 hypothetical protein [Verrucomicrobiota bacterium]